VAATGVILSATYMLWMFQRVNYGPVTNEKNAALPDLQPREWLVIVPIIAVAILMGVLPNVFLRPIEPSVERMLNQYHHGAAPGIHAAAIASPPASARPSSTRASARLAEAPSARRRQPLAPSPHPVSEVTR